jgi:hypothetical protein
MRYIHPARPIGEIGSPQPRFPGGDEADALELGVTASEGSALCVAELRVEAAAALPFRA